MPPSYDSLRRAHIFFTKLRFLSWLSPRHLSDKKKTNPANP